MLGEGDLPPHRRAEPERYPLDISGADLVAEARAALRAFRVDDRRTAKMLLTMWKRRIQLTREQVEEILRDYPEAVELELEPGT